MLPNSHPASRYEIIAKIAAGGMATVYLGAMKGPFGFDQLVAIKKLHAHLLDDASVRESLLIEARSASRIRHANVVDVRDVEVSDDGVQLVMTYVEGASFATLLSDASRNKRPTPSGVAIRIMLDACAGLHAAHELADETGKPLGLVHRDVSPQNILVGIDGITRITDFGVARDESSHRLRTNTGALKGKFAYMAPEYIRGKRPDRRVDVFALAVVLWEALAGRRLFKGNNEAETISRVTDLEPPPIAQWVPELGEGIDSVFDMALSKNPETRFSTAQALGLAIETVALKANLLASAVEVSQYVREHARDELERLQQLRQAAAIKSKSEAELISLGAPTQSAPEITVAVKNPVSSANSPADDTQVAASNYQKQVASMMGDDRTGSSADTPTLKQQLDIATTLRTPTTKHAEVPSPSVEIVSAPPLANEETMPAAKPPKQRGPMDTALMAPSTNMRNLVFRQDHPESNGFPKPTHTTKHNTPSSATTGRHVSSALTLPVPLRRESVADLPFTKAPGAQKAPGAISGASRVRWIFAACFLFLLSGVGLVLLVAPGTQDGDPSSTATSVSKK